MLILITLINNNLIFLGVNMDITLLRHGRPTFKIRGWLKSSELGQMINTYEYAGICGSPTMDTRDHVRDCNVVVCSDLPRSVESAYRLGVKKIHSIDEHYRECELPHFNSGSLMLPTKLWVALLRTLWLLGFSKNAESISHAKERAKQVAYHLIKLAEEHQTVVFVGHGVLNYYVAKELRSLNWRGPKRPKTSYWAMNIYRYR